MITRRMRSVAKASDAAWDDVIIAASETPLRLGLWVLVGYSALAIYPFTEGVQTALRRLPDTGLIFLLAWFGQRLITGIEEQLLSSTRGAMNSDDKATIRATCKLARITLWIIAGLMVLQSLGVSIQGLLAFGGIGGIAVGFAAKDLLANFFGALSIHLDRPFTVGDWIRSPDKEIEGTVETIGWRLTCIRTFDQRPLYVPNAVFSQIALENPSRMFNRRIYETIGLRYEDADKVAAIVDEVRTMLEQHNDIDHDRTLIVNFVSFGPSSLDFFVYTFTKTTVWVDYHQIKENILLQILSIIHANGADIAFPTRTLHIDPSPEAQP
ncbi:MAG: mechanosensitive ion channel family protein [Halioglobus sp.]|nr:mechanosensitive ion channel family protein [Halioglobus sp.]